MSALLTNKGLVHYILNDFIYFSYKFHLYQSDLNFQNIKKLPSLPVSSIKSVLKRFSSFRRMLRYDINHWQILPSGVHIIIAAQSIYRMEPGGDWEFVSTVNGKRLLNLCQAANGILYYGDYINNNDRHPVFVWESKDGGITWNKVWRFTGIRHIHGIYYDQYSDEIWVTTGDSDDESGIWVTKDNFSTLDLVFGGCQKFRVIQLLFSKDFVYYGTDSPLEINSIFRYSRNTSKIELLHQVNSSIFWGCKVGDALFFSSAVEPSRVNDLIYSAIWCSSDGTDWNRIASFRKDFLPMKLFQYGQIYFPSGINNSKYLFFSPFATEKGNLIFRMETSKVFSNINGE